MDIYLMVIISLFLRIRSSELLYSIAFLTQCNDKSISLIDTALRRRFDFIEQRPDASLVVDVAMRKILVNLNIALAEQLDSTDLLIGHSYFLNKSISDLPKVFNSSIIPLLYEYFYDNKKKIKTVLNSAIPTDDFEIVDDKIGRIYIERKNT